MRLAATTLLMYGVLILGLGLVAYVSTEDALSLAGAGAASALLFGLASRANRGSLPAGYAGGVITFLSAIYFAYRLVATERLLPYGVLLVVSFIALFGVTLGVFLGLRHRT